MKHIVVEGNCIFDLKSEGMDVVPKCCVFGPENISKNCFNFGENKYCPYLIFGTARAALVLTDGKGEAVNAASYWGDTKISAEEWIREENRWIKKQSEYLSNESSNNE